MENKLYEHMVFVYGTLKMGQNNHHLLEHATYVGKGFTLKPFYMASVGGFPVVTDHKRLHNVAGEIYEVDDVTLKRLDRLEGHPDWYCRQEVIVDVADTGIPLTCWMYVGVYQAWCDRLTHLPAIQPNSIGAYSWRE